MRVILASSSPYRQALLKQIHLPFRVEKPMVDESRLQRAALPPGEIAARLAALKGEGVAARFPGDLVIACDQVAHFRGEILSKPGSSAGACAQLARLSGQEHGLSTALWVKHPTLGVKTHLDETHIYLHDLTGAEIGAYVENDRPTDCAGAYKIESAGMSLIRRIECEDQSAVVGLPLIALGRMLREWGFSLPLTWKPESP